MPQIPQLPQLPQLPQIHKSSMYFALPTLGPLSISIQQLYQHGLYGYLFSILAVP